MRISGIRPDPGLRGKVGFLAFRPDRRGAGDSKVFGTNIYVRRFYRDGKFSFAGSTGSKNTVLQSYREKTIKTYIGPTYLLTGICFDPLDPVQNLIQHNI